MVFLILKWSRTGSSESTLGKIPHCWKSHVTAQIEYSLYSLPDKAAAFPAINDSSVPLVYKSGEMMPFRIVLDTRAPETGRCTKYKLFKIACHLSALKAAYSVTINIFRKFLFSF